MQTHPLTTLIVSLALLLTGYGSRSSASVDSGANNASHAAFFSNYCTSCHGDQVQQAGLSLSGKSAANQSGKSGQPTVFVSLKLKANINK